MCFHFLNSNRTRAVCLVTHQLAKHPLTEFLGLYLAGQVFVPLVVVQQCAQDAEFVLQYGVTRPPAQLARNFYSVFSTLFLIYFSCCLPLVNVSFCLFLILKMFW